MSLAKRIIGVIFIENGLVVRRVLGKTEAIIGKPETTVKFLINWDIDELFLIDVSRNKFEMGDILDIALNNCFIPVTLGGNLSTLADIKHCFRIGGDKIVIGRHATQEFCKEITDLFGVQALVVSLDQDHFPGAKKMVGWPIGELILHDRSRDGLGIGLNLELFEKIERLPFPVIGMGGVGDYQDIVNGLNIFDAVAVGNLFHFKEISAKLAKREATRQGLLVRN